MIDNGVGFSDDALRQFGGIEKSANRLGQYALRGGMLALTIYCFYLR